MMYTAHCSLSPIRWQQKRIVFFKISKLKAQYNNPYNNNNTVILQQTVLVLKVQIGNVLINQGSDKYKQIQSKNYLPAKTVCLLSYWLHMLLQSTGNDTVKIEDECFSFWMFLLTHIIISSTRTDNCKHSFITNLRAVM